MLDGIVRKPLCKLAAAKQGGGERSVQNGTLKGEKHLEPCPDPQDDLS